jgi:hypothetical protein
LIRGLPLLLSLTLAVSLSACVDAPPRDQSTTGRPIVVEGVVIRNELAYPVNDVMIEVPATGNFAGCGNILPRSECRNTFEGVDYQANAVVIRWKEHGQPQQTDEFTIKLPQDAAPGDAFVVEVVVFAPGQAGARLLDATDGAIRNP